MTSQPRSPIVPSDDELPDSANMRVHHLQNIDHDLAEHISGPLRLLSLPALLSMDIPPQPQLLAPILRERGTMMVHAKRGVGKTYLALGMAYAVASGGKYLRWEAPSARKVLYIDGEMPLVVLQERLAGIVAGSATEAASENFQILAADYFEEGLPNLATNEGQSAMEPFLEGVGLVVLDNLSTLASTVRDNDADSWSPMQTWILRLKRRGISVLLIQHSGKSGAQRGTSRKEDVLDTVVSLRHPEDYSPTDGARFEVHFEKARGFFGDDAKPFEAKLEKPGGSIEWTTRDVDDSKMAQVEALSEEGLTVREIGNELGISKSAAQRLKTKIAMNREGSLGAAQ